LVKLAIGLDACDHALIDAAPVEWVVGRFDRLVVGSGDHSSASYTTSGGLAARCGR
jgi:hypothetical protein